MTAVLLVQDDPPLPLGLALLTEPVPGGPPGNTAGVAGTGTGTGTGTRAGVVTTVVQVVRADTGTLVVDRHLRVDAGAADPWRMAADVLIGRGGPPQVTALARRHPGALVVAAHHGGDCWMQLGIGQDRPVRAHWREPEGGAAGGTGLPWPLWASAVHAWLVAGIPPEDVCASSALVLGPARDTGTAQGTRTMPPAGRWPGS
jgi:hypothetical protein